MEIKAKILICDENDDERAKLADNLVRGGYPRPDEAKDGNMALDMINRNTYDALIIDLWLSKVDGIGIIRAVSRLEKADKPVMILIKTCLSGFYIYSVFSGFCPRKLKTSLKIASENNPFCCSKRSLGKSFVFL